MSVHRFRLGKGLAPVSAAALLCGAMMAGCGGSSGGSNVVTQLVTRARGGTVSYGSAASVTIPPNALAADTAITIQPAGSLPAAPSGLAVIAVTGFRFGPDATAFSAPVTLTLSYDPAQLPSNVSPSSLTICTVVGGGWQGNTATVDTTAHKVTISPLHFSTYAILGMVLLPL